MRYKTRSRIRRAKRVICAIAAVIAVIAMMTMIGAVGQMEQETISLAAAVEKSLKAGGIMTAAIFVALLCYN